MQHRASVRSGLNKVKQSVSEFCAAVNESLLTDLVSFPAETKMTEMKLNDDEAHLTVRLEGQACVLWSHSREGQSQALHIAAWRSQSGNGLANPCGTV